MIEFSIDGKEVSGQEGWTILEVAKTHGIDIPTLCYHPAVEPFGGCRLCVVEVDDGRRSRVVVSCIYPIRNGIKVLTSSERVDNVRRWIVQLLLDEGPGSVQLQQLAKTYGVKPSRFKAETRGNCAISAVSAFGSAMKWWESRGSVLVIGVCAGRSPAPSMRPAKIV